ncbi:MAG: nucleotidyltransferase family protein [Bacteroidaceae bacterium]|jgi:hypothetical protein
MKRKPVYVQLCNLLSAGLGVNAQADPTLFPKGETDWESVYSLSQQQAVVAVAWDGLLTLPKELHPEKELFYKWFSRVVETERANQRVNSALQELDKLMVGEFKMPYVCLKGQGTAALYPHPQHRSCGDIDFYAGRNAAKRLDTLLESHGFQIKSHSTKHSEYSYKGVDIENHYMIALFFWLGNAWKLETLVKEWFPGGIVSRTLQQAEGSEPLTIPVAPSWFEALFSVIHFSAHLRLEGVGLRHLCDWYVLVHQPGLDIDRYSQGLHLLGLAYMASAMDRLSLSLLEGKKVRLRKMEQKVEDAIWKGGNFGHHAEDAYDHAFASSGGFWRVMFRLFRHDVRRSCDFFRLAPMECLLTPLFRVAGYVRRRGGIR